MLSIKTRGKSTCLHFEAYEIILKYKSLCEKCALHPPVLIESIQLWKPVWNPRTRVYGSSLKTKFICLLTINYKISYKSESIDSNITDRMIDY